MQSPIELQNTKVIGLEARKLSLVNYEHTLDGPLKIENNGHTVEVHIPSTQNGEPACLCGCLLRGVYSALQLHFHWGSESSKGSEHTIDSQRYDAEMHIVHKNAVYKTTQEALQCSDGFVVLGLLLKCVDCPAEESTGLSKIFKSLDTITNCGCMGDINEKLCMGDLLQQTDVTDFFTYRGSLTTPPCAESVDWFVFANPIEVSRKEIQKFWLLRDARGKRLINNFRNLQNINSRPVYLRKQSAL